MDTRISRDTAFLAITKIVAERGTCQRAKVGAVIARDHRIISMGYNGAPPGMDHCLDVGCEDELIPVGGALLEVEGCARCVHAEANAVAFAAKAGAPIGQGESTMYCTHAPCYTCAKLMISAGIVAVHYVTPYRDTRGLDLLDKAGVFVKHHG